MLQQLINKYETICATMSRQTKDDNKLNNLIQAQYLIPDPAALHTFSK
jgi:hypothetical protein